MLAIRMQRTGRRGHAHFRVVVQDSRQSPKSGKFVALLGSYDPHTKTTSLSKEKAQTYIKNGAQPSERVAALLKSEGVKLPDWVATVTKKEGKVRNPEKLRRNRPAQEPKAEVVEAKPEPTEEIVTETAKAEETNEPTTASSEPEEKNDAEVVEAELPEPETKE